MKKWPIPIVSIQDWSTLTVGEIVEVRRHGVVDARGRVVYAAEDGSSVWLFQEGAMGLRKFLSADNVKISRNGQLA
jgi:hypothetical protein